MDNTTPKKITKVTLRVEFADGTSGVLWTENPDTSDPDHLAGLTMCTGGADAVDVRIIPNYFVTSTNG